MSDAPGQQDGRGKRRRIDPARRGSRPLSESPVEREGPVWEERSSGRGVTFASPVGETLDLDAIVGGLSSAGPPLTLPPAPPREVPWLALGVVVALGLSLGAFAGMWFGPEPEVAPPAPIEPGPRVAALDDVDDEAEPERRPPPRAERPRAEPEGAREPAPSADDAPASEPMEEPAPRAPRWRRPTRLGPRAHAARVAQARRSAPTRPAGTSSPGGAPVADAIRGGDPLGTLLTAASNGPAQGQPATGQPVTGAPAARPGRGEVPARPAREQVERAILSVAPAIRDCAPTLAGRRATLSVRFVSSGRVTVASVDLDAASPAQRSCMARAARRASIPAFGQPSIDVVYPLGL